MVLRIKSFLTVLGAALPLALSTGCLTNSSASAGSGDDYADVDPNLKSDDASFFSESGAVGCATGAGLGILACLLSNSDDKLTCSIAAGVGGCAVGMTANYILDNVRANYHTTEEQLDATSAQVEKDLETTKKLHALSKQSLAQDREQVKALKRDYQRGKATKADLEKKDRELAANVKYLSTQKREAQNRLAAAKEARNGVISDAGGADSLQAQNKARVRKLDREIAKLQSQIDGLNDTIIGYNDQRNSLKVKS